MRGADISALVDEAHYTLTRACFGGVSVAFVIRMIRVAESAGVGVITALWLLLASSPALAQGENAVAFIPTELSVGLGAVVDWNPNQVSGEVNLGLFKVYVRDQWIECGAELGLGPTSDEARCQGQDERLGGSETCADLYFLAGPRFRPLRESDRVWRPFVDLLMGGYWKGTGTKDDYYLPANFALQTGGGIDFRRPESIHGLRLSGNYRRVFADERGRHQLRIVVSYFVGWRGETR